MAIGKYRISSREKEEKKKKKRTIRKHPLASIYLGKKEKKEKKNGSDAP